MVVSGRLARGLGLGLAMAVASSIAGCGDDGSGGPDATECVVVDDGNECTRDACEGGVLVHEPITPGTACATGSCDASGACATPTCSDGFHNGDETDVDCGGACAPARTCAAGLDCERGADCTSNVCTGMVCQAPRCGDGLMQPGERCDDGNDNNGDGCDDGAGDACRPTGCGNGVISAPEVCDDGNAANGDGCDNNCTPTGCGNGVATGAETCDDGDAMGGDGCSATCTIELGFTCSMAVPAVCTTVCGDGIRAGGEGCDDAPPAEAGDGCSAFCTVELGYACGATSPSMCSSSCGDGILASNEGCDDAPPAENGDGCSMACVVEAGFVCTGTMPSLCVRRCGNGTIEPGEQCDDANMIGGDGCSNLCQLDIGCPAGQVARMASASPQLAIPDNDPVGISSPIALAGAGAAVTRAVVFVRAITHPFVGDLELALVSPSGARRQLVVRRGNNGDDFRQTYFVDSAAASIATGVAPFTGRFRPEQSLATTAGADFLGVGASGTWNLNVRDIAGQDEGTLDAWSLVVCVDPAAPFCGDGVRTGAEECDDGNLVDTDACDNLCQLGAGCGDGDLDLGEACDDDNTVSGDGCSAVCTVDITCPAGQTSVVLTAAGMTAIPDNDVAGASRPIVVATVGAVTRVSAVIRGITHTAAGDLDVFLVGPGGLARELSTDNGASGDDYAGTQFDDAAAASITTGAPPFTGRFRPEQSLSTAAGTDFLATRAAGTWSLRARDDTAGETGTLGAWTLAACVDPAAPFCGDGVTNGSEECDDGNLVDTDGCSSLCGINGCGDGDLDPGEVCDDDNLISGDGCSPACVPDIACAPGQQAVVLSQTTSAAIPDNHSGVISGIAIPQAGLVRRVIAIVNVSHAASEELDLFLRSPRGVQRDLSSDQPGAGYRATIFSDSAAPSITAGVAPYTGAFQPEQAISSAAGFGGQQAQGLWTLRLGDDSTGTAGTLDRWSLALCIDAAAGATVCGNGVVENGETCDDGALLAGDGCGATCQVELGCAAGQTAIVTSAADLPRLILDNDPAGVSSVINVAGAGNVVSAVVVIGTVTHTFDGDLDLALISPAATMVDLSSSNGGPNDDYVSTIFAAGAATPITAAVPPMRGRFSPEGDLATVAGGAAAGAWTLKVTDHGPIDAGVVVSWTLGLCVQ